MCVKHRHKKLKCVDVDENDRDWARIPDVLLMNIVERLSLSDSVSFSNVCMSFRCVAADLFSDKRSSSSTLPWLVMSGEHNTKIRTCFSILERKVIYLEMPNSCGRYIWGSFEHWLVMVTPPDTEENGKHHQISLLNPFLGNVEVVLPDIVTRLDYSQLVASGSPYDPSTVYMLVGNFRTDLALWTQGCKSWCEYGKSSSYSRMGIFCNGYFYIMEDVSCNIRQIEVKSASHAIRIDGNAANMRSKYYELGEPCVLSREDYWMGYLVESCGEVLFVARIFKVNAASLNYADVTTYKFKVFRLDLCKLEWISVDDLGDRVLLLGQKCSRSASSKEIGVEIGNCIYFTNEYSNLEFRNEWSDFIPFFDKRVKGSGIEDWGCYKLGSEDIYYPSIQNNWNSTWISAPLWWYGLICPTL